MNQIFEKEITVSGFECDFRGCMKYSALLRQAQQISREHSDEMGITLELHQQTNTAFLINDVKATMYHQLHPYDVVTLRTQPFAPYRATFYRTTELWKGGTLQGVNDTNWILIDTVENKILREYDPRLSALFDAEEKLPPKHRIQKLPTAPSGVFLASYSVIVQNKHLNNADYADIACNCTPMETPVSSLLIRYHRECKYQEAGSLFTGGEDNLWYVCGQKNEGKKCFEANLWFA